MVGLTFTALGLLPVFLACANASPVFPTSDDQAIFTSAPRNVTKSIAIVGAGSAGLAVLKAIYDLPPPVRHGWEVVLYEQRRDVGGIWLPDPPAAPLPAPGEGLPETPLYPRLHTNTPHPDMTYPHFPFPPRTPLYPPHQYLQRYHRHYAEHFGLVESIRLNHTVVAANWVGDADEGRWDLRVHGEGGKERRAFDHLVVANGHNHYPHIPEFEGSEEWLRNTPPGGARREIVHSIYYRDPEAYANRTVLVVGAAASGQDISGQVGDIARKTYISYRPSGRIPMRPLPRVVHKPAITRFTPTSILFADNTSLSDVDAVVLATGYEFRIPFLSAPHSSVLAVDPATHLTSGTAHTLVSNTRYVFPLHRHIFSLAPAGPPPRALAFVGLPVLVANCPSDAAQALLVAHALADAARVLPARQEMLAELLRREDALRADGFEPYVEGHRLVGRETSHDYQDALVEHLKEVGALPKDGKKFVEGWRRAVRGENSMLLRRAWERVQELGQEGRWLEGVESEEEWARLMLRLIEWQRRYEEERGVVVEDARIEDVYY